MNRLLKRSITALLVVGLGACQSIYSAESDITEPENPTLETMDFTGAWTTPCIPVNDKRVRTVFLELLQDGQYQMESSQFEDQDCRSIDNRIFFQTESGSFTINEPVEVPTGVVAIGVFFEVQTRETNGVPVSVSDDQGFLDLLHRNRNLLVRAKGNRVGVAGVQRSEELDFSIAYFLD